MGYGRGLFKAAYASSICALVFGFAKAGQQTHRAPAKPQKSVTATPPSPAPPIVYTDSIRENNIGVALMERHQFSEALSRFQRACILNPTSDTGCLNVGIALLYMGQTEDAEAMLKKSADRTPGNPRGWFNLGLLEREAGRLDPATENFEKVADLDPEDAETQYFLGYLAEEAQQYEKASAYFQDAIAIDPSCASAQYGLSQAEEHLGDEPNAQAHLTRFDQLIAAGFAKPVRFVYGEQGKYSFAQEMEIPPLPAQAAIPVHFLDVTSVSGLPWRPFPTRTAAPRTNGANRGGAKPSAQTTKPSLAEFLGSGACVFDYDGDGKPDIFLVNADGSGHAALYRNLGNGKFADVTKAAKLNFSGVGTGCAVGDYDNDGRPDVAIGSSDGITLFHNEGKGTFADVTDAAGLRTSGLVLGLTFVDYDGDGKLDLYVTRFTNFPVANVHQPFQFPEDQHGPGNMLWRNQGDGTFRDVTRETGVATSAPGIGIVATDINNDRAVDLVVTGWEQFPGLLLNTREGGFRAANPWAISMPGPAAGAVAFDFSHEGWMDLAFTHWALPGVSVWRNVEGKSFQRVPLIGPSWMRGWGIAAIDYDNDGWMDLAAVGETFSGEGRIVLYRNEGSAGFRNVTHETGLDRILLYQPRSLIAFDFDGDGATDLLITQNGGPPVLLKNIGGNKNSWIEIGLSGDADNRAGLGARLQMSAGVQRQQLQVSGASGYLGQGPGTTAGLGQEGSADAVRIVWPSGAVQDEIQVPGQKRTVIAQTKNH